eukprot:7475944-Pyramimonas_sp.AAC.2
MDQSDAGSMGTFPHDGPIGRRKHGYIPSRWTNRTQEAWVYALDGPIGRRKHGYILLMDQSASPYPSFFAQAPRASVCLALPNVP